MKAINLLYFVLLPILSCGQSVSNKYNTNKANVLIDGYDVVCYQNNEVKKGNSQYSSTYDEIILYFSSNKNKILFDESPEKYLPKYGGWCAYAIGENGDRVTINPNTYKLINGELYLFYNKNFTNTLNLWNKEEEKLKMNAENYWGTHY